MAKDISEEYM